MFKRLLNELTLELDISPHESPLLIKSGREAGADPTLPDMNFVRTAHPQSGETTVYLPGSSLKGTLRSYSEKVARTVRTGDNPRWCCNPFDQDSFCGKQFDGGESPAAERYAHSCVACRTFGHTHLGSHLLVSDAYPVVVAQVRLEERDGVAIDRISGAVAAGPFNMEVVTRGTFRTKLVLRNYQLWQVGLLAVTLRDLAEGRVPLGFGKSKGFGRLSLSFQRLEVSYPGRFEAVSEGNDYSSQLVDLWGFDFHQKAHYRLFPAEPPRVDLPSEGRSLVEDGAYGRFTVELQDPQLIRNALQVTVGHWRDAAQMSSWPPGEGG